LSAVQPENRVRISGTVAYYQTVRQTTLAPPSRSGWAGNAGCSQANGPSQWRVDHLMRRFLARRQTLSAVQPENRVRISGAVEYYQTVRQTTLAPPSRSRRPCYARVSQANVPSQSGLNTYAMIPCTRRPAVLMAIGPLISPALKAKWSFPIWIEVLTKRLLVRVLSCEPNEFHFEPLCLLVNCRATETLEMANTCQNASLRKGAQLG
jgi:hypothetical protein